MDRLLKNQQEKTDNTVNLVDILLYLLGYWKWISLSVVLLCSYFYYNYSRSPFMYVRSVTVMVKNADKAQSTMKMNRYNSFMGDVNVAAEILQLSSKELMRKAIDRLQANVSYQVSDGLRRQELYSESPVRIYFSDVEPDEMLAFTVVPRSRSQVELSYVEEGVERRRTVALNDTLSLRAGRMTVYATANYDNRCFGKALRVIHYPREAVMGMFMSNITLRQPDKDAPVLQFSMTDTSPLRAADLLNTLIDVFNEESRAEKNRAAVNMADFLRQRLSIIEGELGNVETDIEMLKEQNSGVDINTAAKMYIADSRQYGTLLKELDVQMQLVYFILSYLQDDTKAGELLPNSAILQDLDINRQIERYNELLLTRKRLIEDSSVNHPVVSELERSLKALRGNIIRAVNNLEASLVLKKKNFDKEDSRARQNIYGVPRKQREALSVERQQKVKEDLYVFLLTKWEENAMNQALTDNTIRVMDRVSGSDSPVSPSLYRKLLLGGGLGLFLPCAILLLVRTFDTVVHSRKDLENVLTIPLLGEIPLQLASRKAANTIRVSAEGCDALSEAFRIFRTNLGMVLSQGEKKVVTFTSVSPHAGKTFMSINLAVSMRLVGKKVILLDLDLRKGNLSHVIRKRQEKGVAHYLAQSSLKPEDVIVRDCFGEGIDFIPVGAIAPNPTELLLSDRLDTLLARLKELYDIVIIDNVPMGIVADTSITNRVTDVTVFIIRAGKFSRRQLPEVERLYVEHKLTNLCVLLNAVKKKHVNHGYGYGYYGSVRKKSWYEFWKCSGVID